MSRSALLLLGLACVPYLLGLGDPPLWDANEPLYAEPPKEVLEWPEGDFWIPTWNGRPYYAHPPLSTWITVPFYAVLGANETAERLPMAIAACLTLLATYVLGARLMGPRAGLLAALALAATPRVWLYSRQLAGDVYLTALLTWAFVLAARSLATGSRGAMWGGHALVGVACLAKGIVAPVIWSGTLVVTWALAHPRPSIATLRPLALLAALLLLGLPWFVLAGDAWGQHFGHYTFGRVAGNIGVRDATFYLKALLAEGQPWIFLLPVAARMAMKARDRAPATLLPWVVVGVTLVLFTLSKGKRNVYLMPLYPMLAVLAAPVLLGAWDGLVRGLARTVGIVTGVASALAAACLFLLARNEPRLTPEIWLPAAAFGLGGPLLVAAGVRGVGKIVVAILIGGILAIQSTVAVAFPALSRLRPVPVLADRIREEQAGLSSPRRALEPVVLYRVPIHSLVFYLGRRTQVAGDAAAVLALVSGETRGFVVTYEERIPELAAEGTGLEVREIARGPLLVFRFESAILGKGKTTRDLVLLEVRRRADASPPEEPAGSGR